MADRLPAIVRPNGKTYQPRKIVAHAWEDPWAPDDIQGVIVTGTHDIERARTLAAEACAHFFGLTFAIKPRVWWYRSGYRYGEPAWIDDPIRGAAGISFAASDYPELASDAAEEGRTDG